MSRKSSLKLFLIVTISMLPVIASAQYRPELVSIKNINGGTTFRFGDSLNIQLKYRVVSPATNENALEFIKNYFLVINSVPHRERKFKDMPSFLNIPGDTTSTIVRDLKSRTDSVTKKTITDTVSHKETITEYFITFQASLPDAEYTDSNTTVSAFWKQVYIPFRSKRAMSIQFSSDQPAVENSLTGTSIILIFYKPAYLFIFLVVFTALLIFVLIKASKDKFTLLRDDPVDPVNACSDPYNNPFSLSRVQVFIWTFVIFGMIAYLWSITDFFPVITASHLVLLGIAAGQRILAQIIDSSKKPMKNTVDPDTLDKANLAGDVPPPPNSVCSKGFFTDLISDKSGLSITRLQYLIVTFIFLVMFISTAFGKLQLMSFTIEQLALMGTSAGLYLWTKRLDQQ